MTSHCVPAGNQEAQEIVSMLYNRVSHDGNPDDMGQIKDILRKKTPHNLLPLSTSLPF